ncbi:hypothetical protein ACFSL6_20490 [Paenibacillus thailandensis]|uniref:hypothetical protein n=1 Tax=Paenibacillus thailandensis TaxID=393250 RepID=UPI00363DE1EF
MGENRSIGENKTVTGEQQSLLRERMAAMEEIGTPMKEKDRLPVKTVELNVEDILTQIGIPRTKWPARY